MTIKAYSAVQIAESTFFFSINYSSAQECSEIGSHLHVHYRTDIAISITFLIKDLSIVGSNKKSNLMIHRHFILTFKSKF